MKKNVADVVAIKMAVDYVKIHSFGSGSSGEVFANNVADFIKTLSSRLQDDVDDTVLANVIDKP